jgi:hypothetical protein
MSRQNHLWDCEALAAVAGYMLNVQRIPEGAMRDWIPTRPSRCRPGLLVPVMPRRPARWRRRSPQPCRCRPQGGGGGQVPAATVLADRFAARAHTHQHEVSPGMSLVVPRPPTSSRSTARRPRGRPVSTVDDKAAVARPATAATGGGWAPAATCGAKRARPSPAGTRPARSGGRGARRLRAGRGPGQRHHPQQRLADRRDRPSGGQHRGQRSAAALPAGRPPAGLGPRTRPPTGPPPSRIAFPCGRTTRWNATSRAGARSGRCRRRPSAAWFGPGEIVSESAVKARPGSTLRHQGAADPGLPAVSSARPIRGSSRACRWTPTGCRLSYWFWRRARCRWAPSRNSRSRRATAAAARASCTCSMACPGQYRGISPAGRRAGDRAQVRPAEPGHAHRQPGAGGVRRHHHQRRAHRGRHQGVPDAPGTGADGQNEGLSAYDCWASMQEGWYRAQGHHQSRRPRPLRPPVPRPGAEIAGRHGQARRLSAR